MHIDDVQKWCTLHAGGGTGHIVVSTGDYTMTACGTLSSRVVAITDQRPKRICRKCRAVLDDLRPLGSSAVAKGGDRNAE